MVKIIDKEGRLFGRINVIDFIVLLFILGLMPMFYYGYRIFKLPHLAPINWEQRYNEKVKEYEKKVKEYDEEIAKKEKVFEEVFKEHPRLKKYFH